MKKFVINFFASLFATIILFGLLLFICLITPISLVVMYYIDVIYIKLFLILIFCWIFYITYNDPSDIRELFNKDNTDKSNLTLKKGKWKND